MEIEVLFEKSQPIDDSYRIIEFETTEPSQNIIITDKAQYFDSILTDESVELISPNGSEQLTYTIETQGKHNFKFKFKPNLTDLSKCFMMVENVSAIPENLFDGLKENLENLNTFFATNTKISEIPANIFKGCSKLKDVTAFFTAPNVTSIPEDLLSECPALEIVDGLFMFTNITEIPENIFANNPNLTSCDGVFQSCKSLTKIPNNLFDKNKNITKFNSAFMGCSALTGATPTGTDGIELWERAGQSGYPIKITLTKCFSNCSGLDNYDSIPAEAK